MKTQDSRRYLKEKTRGGVCVGVLRSTHGVHGHDQPPPHVLLSCLRSAWVRGAARAPRAPSRDDPRDDILR